MAVDVGEGRHRYEFYRGRAFIDDASNIVCTGHRDGHVRGVIIRPRVRSTSSPAVPSRLEERVIPRGDNVHLTLEWGDADQRELWFEIDESRDGGPFEYLRALPANTTTIIVDRSFAVRTPRARAYRIRAVNFVGESDWVESATVSLPSWGDATQRAAQHPSRTGRPGAGGTAR